jgi:ABC-type nickel/cobalt efflux system permease component RcnA
VHVAGALVLAGVAQLAMAGMAVQSVEDLRPVKLASYAAVAAIGLWLLFDRLRRRQTPDCAHDHGHGHDHGHAHDHGKQGGLVSFVAGMVPCTGALLVVLYCFANGILHYGLLFVLLIGLGMAVTLTGFGLVGMFARRRALALAERGAGAGDWRRAMDLGGPALIVAIGALLFVGAY